MTIQTRKEAAAMVVTVAGRMDAVTAPEYEKSLRDLISGGETNFVIDFEHLDYISSAGLRALLSTAKRIKAVNGKVLIANISGSAREVFDISGFSTMFPVHDSLSSALNSFVG